MTTDAFISECIQKFKNHAPTWMPPHVLIMNLAKKRKLKVKINGKREGYWTITRLDRMVEDIDERLNNLKVNVDGVVVRLEWIDCRKLVRR